MAVGRHAERLDRAARVVGEAGLDALLVTPGPDLLYLTGHAPPPLERLTLLVIAPGRGPVLLVPLLERPAALASPAADRIEVLGWADAEDPYAVAAGLLPPGVLAVTDQTWASHVLGLREAAANRTLVAAGRAMPPLRAVKDEKELAVLAKAASAADAAFADIVVVPFAGRREADVAADLADALRRHGHRTADFTIVGSGPNGASPHHEAGERVIAEGDAVVLDFGGHLGGYCSDMTRTVFVGEPPKEFDRVHDCVRRAQQAAFEAVRPGARAEEVDRAARDVIDDAGYGEWFIHRTGHGIGLEAHEPPYIVAGDRTKLEAGMTFSIEPGIYLPDRFGVRIEDIVAVTGDGARRLNEAPRELLSVR
ncbi:MAG TPA: Xaa-Pro peptidase family protein [Actinomycetota bacterium]|jgi:D-alanyl-D-alanine dipeptidase